MKPSQLRKQLEARHRLLGDLIQGLQDGSIYWGGARQTYTRLAKKLGVTIVTETGAKKLGRRLKPRAKPIGRGYFRAPLSLAADLYILECHTDRERDPEAAQPGRRT